MTDEIDTTTDAVMDYFLAATARGRCLACGVGVADPAPAQRVRRVLEERDAARAQVAQLRLLLRAQATTAPPAHAPPPRAVAAIVAHPDGTRALFVRSRKHMPGRNVQLPGGHLLPGESAAAAVAREVREETGLSVVAVRWLGRDAAEDCDVYGAALLGAPDPLVAGDDAAAAFWDDPAACRAGLYAHDELAIVRWLAEVRS